MTASSNNTNLNKRALKKLTRLARLKIDEGMAKQLLIDLNNIIAWVELLKELDTEGIEPLIHMSQEINVWREDAVGTHLQREQALNQAPESSGIYFRVPQFVVKKKKS